MNQEYQPICREAFDFFSNLKLIEPDSSYMQVNYPDTYDTILKNKFQYDLVYLNSSGISIDNLRKCGIIIKQNGRIAIKFYSTLTLIKFMLNNPLCFENYDFTKKILLCRKV